MTKKKKPATEASGEQRKRPPHGGRFIRDPKTGELECVERTESAGIRAKREPAAETESGSDQAGSSGVAAGSGPGSTSGEDGAGNGEGQEGEASVSPPNQSKRGE